MSALHHFARHHARLSIAIALGVCVGLALPEPKNLIDRVLVGWNVTAWCYLGLMGWLMMRTGHGAIRRIAEQEDQSGVVVLATMSLAATASFAAIFLELPALKALSAADRLAHYAFTGATIFGSWCVVATMFTFHYARMYYQSAAKQRSLAFPEDLQDPDYWDFLYFSFTIAVAVQTSDVVIMSRSMRKAVLAQSLLSFFFNVAILGLSINIAAGLVAPD